MMKKIVRIIFLGILLTNLGLNAQPILTYKGNVPVVGDKFLVRGTSITSKNLPTSGGRNQVWDYSSIVDSGAIGTIKVVDTAGMPGAVNYANANIAWYDPIKANYIYFNNTNPQTFGEIGEYYSTDVWGVFSPQITRMAFPMTYQKMYADSAFFTNSSISGISFQVYDTIVADGYGKLKLPHNAIYDSVLRVKLTLRIVYYFNSFPIYDSTSYFYEFGIDGIHYPILELSSQANNTWLAQYFAGLPLPLQIFNFKASWQNNYPYLSWNAENTSNTKQFIVQRSADGTIFNDIGNVQISANPSYQFIDKGFLSANYHYRLKQIGKDGSVFYSDTQFLQTSNPSSFNVFPNPTKGGIHIYIPSGNIVSIYIYDAAGKLMYTNKAFSTRDAINTTSWIKGIYMIKIRDEDGWHQKSFTKD